MDEEDGFEHFLSDRNSIATRMPVRSLLSILAVALVVGAAPAAGASSADLIVTDRVLVGDFGGYGGQLNQHVYAKVSGPPPGLPRRQR